MGLDTDLPKLIEEIKVGTGVKCLLYRNESNPTLTVYGSVRAGTAYEPAEKQGLAELAARLLIRGSQKLKAAKVAEMLESVGATASFRNTQDSIVFQARTTSTWTQRVLKILSECLTNPSFGVKDTQKEKEELLTDIRLRDDDTVRRGMRELLKVIYPPDHPYKRDRLGTAESVKRIERKDIVDYYQDKAEKAEVVVSFAGMFDKEEAVRWTEKAFGERTEETEVTPKWTAGETTPETREISMPHKMQADILLGSRATSRTDVEFEPLNLLNVIMGELGFMGRLGQRVRDKEGLAYSCTSFLNAGTLGGSWTALAGVNPRNVTRAVDLMREELARACEEPVAKAELEAAKQNQIGSALMELESTEGIARTSHNLALFQLGLDYFSRRREFYQKIEETDILKMAQKYLEPTRLSSVIVGPGRIGKSSKS